jgi:hypothetical protein
MAAITLPKGALLQIYGVDASANGGDGTTKWNTVTDHNRGQFTINHNRIEQSRRMANGTLRKFFVADKEAFNVSWDLVPSYRTETVDGYWGAEDLRTFYNSTLGQGTFDIRINYAKNGSSQVSSGYEAFTVSFTDCSFDLVKRGIQAHWNISLSMEEV